MADFAGKQVVRQFDFPVIILLNSVVFNCYLGRSNLPKP
jgi:hypothetical protein